MKILMTTDNIGGVWTFATDMVRGLKKYGTEVVLAVIGEPLTHDQENELSHLAYRHFTAKQEWMEDPWENVYASGKWLLWLKELENPDIIHLNSYTLGCLQWNIPVIITMHSCVLSWWESVKNQQAPDSWNNYHEHVKAGIQSADFITAPSNFMLKAAEKHYGPFRNRKVICNGRNPDLFKRRNKEKIVFSMGRLWDEAKNIGLLLEAAEYINYPVFIAGEANSEKLGSVPSNVTFLGRLSPQQVTEWLSLSWVYALPAKYEPFGYSFLEAAFSGCVLVGGNIPSLNEIWKDAMLYTGTDDPGQLAKTINNLMGNDWHLNHMSNKAHTYALANYSDEEMLNKYFVLYKYLVDYKRKLLHH